MTELRKMDLNEFREAGYLQEVNRNYLHPLGLALEVVLDGNGKAISLGGIWDCRDDPDGFVFDEFDTDRAMHLQCVWDQRAAARLASLGFVVQPLPKMLEGLT